MQTNKTTDVFFATVLNAARDLVTLGTGAAVAKVQEAGRAVEDLIDHLENSAVDSAPSSARSKYTGTGGRGKESIDDLIANSKGATFYKYLLDHGVSEEKIRQYMKEDAERRTWGAV